MRVKIRTISVTAPDAQTPMIVNITELKLAKSSAGSADVIIQL